MTCTIISFKRMSVRIHEKLFIKLINNHVIIRDKNTLLMSMLCIFFVLNKIVTDKLFDNKVFITCIEFNAADQNSQVKVSQLLISLQTMRSRTLIYYDKYIVLY